MSSASKRRQSGGEDEGGGANWMDTYGDLVTLLLCFFVLLFAFSSIDAQKWEALLGALSGSTTIQIPVFTPEMAMEKPVELIMTTELDPNEGDPPASASPIGDTGVIEVDMENFNQLYDNLEQYILENQLAAEVIPDYNTYAIIIRFTDNVLFESGSANLTDDAMPVMNHMINLLVQNQERVSMVRVEGHTDNRPISTSEFRDNWVLSVMRASNVQQYIVESGRLDPTRIMVGGYGEYHPVRPNDSPEGQQANRRVDFVIEGIREAR